MKNNSIFKRVINKNIGEEYLSTDISGLNVIFAPKRDFSSKHAVFASKFGSVNSDFNFDGKEYHIPQGTAHFLEHKMFAKPYGDAFEKFSSTGANANAYTSYNHTGYLFSCANNFEESLRILLDTVTTPYFTKQNLESESGIIKQEIDMLHDNPANRCYYNLLECLFYNHPIRYEIAGTEESISRVTPEILYTCHEAFYAPENSYFCCCGDINEDKLANIVLEYFPKQTSKQLVKLRHSEPLEVYMKEKHEKMPVSMPLFCFGIKEKPSGLKGKELIKHSLACEIIADTISSRSGNFFLKMYNDGLINGSFDSDVMCESDFGVFSFSGESETPQKTIEEIKKELIRLKNNGITEREFLRARNNNYGYFLGSFDNCENLAYEYLNSAFDGSSPFDTMDIYNSITLDYINSKLEVFDLNNTACSFIDMED